MTNTPLTLRRGLTWLLAGATFLAVLAAAGCAALCPALRPARGKASNVEPVARHDQNPWPDDRQAEMPQAAHSGVVNVFGEFGGARQTRPMRQIGEAGFQQHTAVDEGEDSFVAVDPSGRWMVYTSTRHSEHPDI